MKPKGKLTLKKSQPPASGKSKTGHQNIADLFKKQGVKHKSPVKNEVNSGSDNEVIILEEASVSPYFKHNRKTNSCSQEVTDSSVFLSKDSSVKRKRKLSLPKTVDSQKCLKLSPVEKLEDGSNLLNEMKQEKGYTENEKEKKPSEITTVFPSSKNNNSLETDLQLTKHYIPESGKTQQVSEENSAFLKQPQHDNKDCSKSKGNSVVSVHAIPHNKTHSIVTPLSNSDSRLPKAGTNSNEGKMSAVVIKKPLTSPEPTDKEKHDDEKDAVDMKEDDVSNDAQNEPEFKIPYYLNNFETILTAVLEDETNRSLFNIEDMDIITSYRNMSDPAKKLYIRLFSRKLNWIPVGKLNYPEIADDLTPCLQELTRIGFIDNEDNLTDLEEVLNALSASDIKALAKPYHIAPSITQKRQLVQELLKKSQHSTVNSISSMFGGKTSGVAKNMLIKAKKYVNGIYKLKAEPRKVFVRSMMLFSVINTSLDDESGNGGQGQLFQLLMVNMGKVVYPNYTVQKVHNIFQGREDVIRFEHALQLESNLLHCTLKGNWTEAFTVYKTVEEELKILEADESTERWNRALPDFLRPYTATSVIYRLLNIGIEILQRRKNFDAAVHLLHKLLAQTTYNCSYRGYWWERLALILDSHLKKPLEALEAVASGLADQFVRVGHRLALRLRAESICQRPKLKLQHKLKDYHHEPVKDMPKIYIEGRVLHEGLGINGSRFLTEESYSNGNAQDMTVCRVEDYVLDYYKKNQFPSGIHAEGSVVSTLFTLFCWDILFMPVPDAFHGPFQSQPLDLYSDSFYNSRKDAIEERLKKLEESSVEELQAIAEETWSRNEGVSCIGMGWERMKSIDCVKELVGCMGGKILGGLIRRYARCPRHTRSGFPDLTLWNTESGALKICEVKGPGDRLSNKQILWIDYLLRLGVDAEVCHVKAVAAKKLKLSG